MRQFFSLLLACALLIGASGALAAEDMTVLIPYVPTDLTTDPTVPTLPTVPTIPTVPTDPTIPTDPIRPTEPTQSAQTPQSGNLEASETLVKLIKGWEGFSPTAFRDGASWSIGYGMHGTNLPSYMTEPEADAQLRRELRSNGAKLNTYLQSVGFTPTQGQFDALLDLTYNVGPNWMGSCRLATAIEEGLSGYTDAEIADFFGVWCHVDGTVLDQLLERRLHNIAIFLYGDYTGEEARRFVTVRFNEGSGQIERDIAFYLKGEPYGELPVATKRGATLLGWQKSDGNMLQPTDIASEDIRVKAVWYDSMYPPETGTRTTPTDPTTPTSAAQPTDPTLPLTLIEPTQSAVTFSDAREGDWFYSYVSALSAEGVINGYPDGSFRPQGSVTLAEALKLILLASGYEEQAPEGGHWAGGYLRFAQEKGFLDPADAGSPDGPITRLLVARIAAAALNLPDDTTVSPFVDTVDGAVLALYSAGIVEGSYVNNIPVFKPGDGLTRAEVSAIVWRIRELVKAAVPIPEEDELPGYYSLPSTYDPLLFHQEGKFMEYGTLQTLRGIDVSSHNGTIDWNAVAAQGIEFAFIRIGFRGYGSTGSMNADTSFEENYAGARAAGLKVGVYFYSQAITEAEALEEADFVITALRGRPVDYPVVFDWEFVNLRSARTFALDRAALTACTRVFCDRVRAAGYTPMTYFSKYIGISRCDLSQLLDIEFWYAQYADMPTLDCPFTIWQYSKTGRLSGIEGFVDLNICFYDYARGIDLTPTQNHVVGTAAQPAAATGTTSGKDNSQILPIANMTPDQLLP